MNRITLVLATSLLAVGLLAGADWRQFRGTDNNPVSEEPVPERFDLATGENVAWNVPLVGRGPSSPIIVGDQVIVTVLQRLAARPAARAGGGHGLGPTELAPTVLGDRSDAGQLLRRGGPAHAGQRRAARVRLLLVERPGVLRPRRQPAVAPRPGVRKPDHAKRRRHVLFAAGRRSDGHRPVGEPGGVVRRGHRHRLGRDPMANRAGPFGHLVVADLASRQNARRRRGPPGRPRSSLGPRPANRQAALAIRRRVSHDFLAGGPRRPGVLARLGTGRHRVRRGGGPVAAPVAPSADGSRQRQPRDRSAAGRT